MRILPGILLLSLVFVTACKKEHPAFSGAKVLSATNLRAGFVDTYTYNGDNNIAIITNNSGDHTTFTYKGDTVIMESLINGTVVASATVYLLRGDAYADTSYGLYQSQNSSAKYTYDGNGQLTRQENYAYGSVTSTSAITLTNKNATTTINDNITAGTQTRYDYAYNTTLNTIGNQNFGKGFLGVGNLYLPTTRVQLNQNGDTLGIVNYRYGLDDNSRVALMTSYDRNGALVDSIAYAY
ncbi:MAG TPA: hypothetical protein VK154_17565 [Chitinophagales bacterium]|nr:hypothetical protein [Chitinophagales bacterium]